jgi:hypothetical protein
MERYRVAADRLPEEIARFVATIEKKINNLVDRQQGQQRLETRVWGFTVPICMVAT